MRSGIEAKLKATPSILAAFMIVLNGLAASASNTSDGLSANTTSRQLRDEEEHKRNMESESRKVEMLYSTEPVRVSLRGREYLVPRNYFGPKGKAEPDTLVATDHGFGFDLFLPDFSGYSKDNWRDLFDKRLIKVLEVKTVDRNAVVKRRDGSVLPIHPSTYGDSSTWADERYSCQPKSSRSARPNHAPVRPQCRWTDAGTKLEFAA